MSDTSTIRGGAKAGNPWSIADQTGGSDERRPRAALNPTLLAYFMAPMALLVILLLMHAGVVVRVPAWQWVLVFVAILASSRAIDHLYSKHPSARWPSGRAWRRRSSRRGMPTP
jgi:hypothetical protein